MFSVLLLPFIIFFFNPGSVADPGDHQLARLAGR